MVCDISVTVFERAWVKAVGECKCVKSYEDYKAGYKYSV